MPSSANTPPAAAPTTSSWKNRVTRPTAASQGALGRRAVGRDERVRVFEATVPRHCIELRVEAGVVVGTPGDHWPHTRVPAGEGVGGVEEPLAGDVPAERADEVDVDLRREVIAEGDLVAPV